MSARIPTRKTRRSVIKSIPATGQDNIDALLARLQRQAADAFARAGLPVTLDFRTLPSRSSEWYAAKLLSNVALLRAAMATGDPGSIAYSAVCMMETVEHANLDGFGSALTIGAQSLTTAARGRQVNSSKREQRAKVCRRVWREVQAKNRHLQRTAVSERVAALVRKEHPDLFPPSWTGKSTRNLVPAKT